MANILVSVEKGIEVAAEDVLKFVTGAQQKTTQAGPGVVSGLGVLLGAFATVAGDVAGVAASPVNIVLDQQTVADIKAVWPDIKAFASNFGIKL